ncbi:MAG: bile acid:sodium symporter [Pirellulaceae bacterium]
MSSRAELAKLLRGNWFLIGLISVVLLGILFHTPLQRLADASSLQTGLVCVVMWMMAAPVPLESVRRTLSHPGPGLLAAIINMGLVPLLALCVAPLLAADLAGGLLVAATVPSTLASAAVWTRKAGGDDTVAILVTLLTNLGCVVVTPLWLVALLGVRVELDLQTLIANLAMIVALPIGLAQLMRLNPGFSRFAEARKSLLATTCQIGILLMVLIGSIQMGARLAIAEGTQALTLAQIVMLILSACGVHVAALVIAWYLSRALEIKRAQRIAVSLSGSQKTLMIGLKLAMDCGVSILPMVVFHVGQLIIDTLIVQRWARQGQGRPKGGQGRGLVRAPKIERLSRIHTASTIHGRLPSWDPRASQQRSKLG